MSDPSSTDRARAEAAPARAKAPGADADPVIAHKTIVYRLCSLFSRVYCRLWHRLEIQGLENLPKTGAFVLATNHQSHVDILIHGGTVPRHVSFVARDTLADARWLAFVMRECGAILIQRGASDRKALRAMADHLALGDVVAIFPEGTRTTDGSLGEFKGGTLLVARLAKVPIVPCGISGANLAMPRGVSIPRPRKIRVAYGAPIDSALPDAQERMVAAVAELSGAKPWTPPRAEGAPAGATPPERPASAT